MRSSFVRILWICWAGPTLLNGQWTQGEFYNRPIIQQPQYLGYAPPQRPNHHRTERPPPPQSFLDRMGLSARHINLPSMTQVSETLGALNGLGRYFLKKTISTPSHPPPQYYPQEEEDEDLDDDSSEEDQKPLPSVIAPLKEKLVTRPPLTVPPERDEQLGNALYTLGRNVLGQNVTDSLLPVVQTVNQIGKFLPPLVYRDGRIILGSSSNATNDGGDIRDVICTTPIGGQGKCLDLSGCPSLLFDLKNLRKSLCFKALFVPGVCCPDVEVVGQGVTQRPVLILTSPRPVPRPTPISTNALSPHYPSEGDVGLPNYPTEEIGQSDSEECGRFEEPSFRIVGGAKSTPGSWPWMAAIFLHGPKGTEFWCGGTLITKQYILTAAHCTKDQKQKSFTPRQFSVRLGDYDLVKTDDLADPQVFRVTDITPHPDFSGMGFYNDVALLRLDRPVSYGRFIKPICLPEGRAGTNTFVGTFATVIGWGTDKYGGRENNALQEVKLPVWSNTECDKTYFQPITDIFLCAGLPAGGKDACQGDSGGPLMLELETGKWTQIGIVSFGNRCAEPGYPGVYTRLTKFTSWIKDNAI